MDSFTLLLALLLIHLVIDFYLQPNSWIDNKRRYPWAGYAIICHAALHGLASAGLLLLLSNWSKMHIMMALGVISLSHYLIDAIKATLSNKARFFVLDQLAHAAVLVLLVVYFDPQGDLHALLLGPINLSELLAIGFAYLLILKPSSLLMSQLLAPFRPDDEHEALPKAGEMIGYLERFLIVTFILCNEWSGIGFLLAAKSVFRFGDLAKSNQVKMTEYVILGTLLSTTIAIVVGQLLSALLLLSFP